MTPQARSMMAAMLCSAAVTAELVSGKATRDALFLTSLNFTELPTMLMAAAACSILLVSMHARISRRIAPTVLVPASFAVSGGLFFLEWLTRAAAPSVTAIAVYLHISASGPLLASGFWLIASERFDPRTARRRFGQIAASGTAGGLVGALISERIAALSGVPDMLLVLAAFHVLTAWMVRRLAMTAGAGVLDPVRPCTAPSGSPAPISGCGLTVVAKAPHLRHLAGLVLFGTMGGALVEYLFKASVVQTFGPGDNLLRFFAIYYAGTSAVTFAIQTLSSRRILERYGLGLASSSPSIALLAGSVGSLVAPGFGSLLIARGGEAIFRGSWFRAGYELCYTPIPAAEKRAAKSVIDVGFDRLGEAAGGGLVRLAVLLAPAAQSSTILALAMISSIGAIVAASRLNHWYVRTLEHSLLTRAGEIDLSDTEGAWTRQLLSRVRRRNAGLGTLRPADTRAELTSLPPAEGLAAAGTVADRELTDIMALRSGDRQRAIDVLTRQDGMPAGLVAHVIPLLAVDALADYALFALRKVAEEHVGHLSDTLLDPTQDYAVRRRLARVFSVCVSQRAADALLLTLDDERFEVRFQAARSLAAVRDRNPRIQIGAARIYETVLREVTVSRPVWESKRLLDGVAGSAPLDAFVRDRAGHSLGHVFTLLSLVLPREPLLIAFRSLQSDDRHLRGTALEYLEGVLPVAVRTPLWPFLVPRRSTGPKPSRDAVLANLLRSHPSVTLQGLAGAEELPAGFSAR